MLKWTQAGDGARLMMLVYHDDADLEFACGAESKIGRFSDAMMIEAKKSGWIALRICVTSVMKTVIVDAIAPR